MLKLSKVERHGTKLRVTGVEEVNWRILDVGSMYTLYNVVFHVINCIFFTQVSAKV